MSDAPAQLKLTPQERRIVMAIGLVVVLVLNYLFVWPHFGEWGRTRRQLNEMYATMEKYKKEIDKDVDPTNGYNKQLGKLIKQEGAGVMDKQVQLQSTVLTQAKKCGVSVDKVQPVGSRVKNNEFFDEEAIQIQVQSQEPQLINFLYNIGNDPSMIRVIELSLKPMESTRYHLGGAITLAANYRKAAPVAPAPKPKAAGAKPPQSGGPPAAGAHPPNAGAKPPVPGQKGPPAPKPGPNPNPRPGPNPNPRVPPSPKPV